MKQLLKSIVLGSSLLAGTAAMLVFPAAGLAQSGQVNKNNVVIEPALNDATGTTVFILETQKSPFPVKANPAAVAPLYAVVYPTSSGVDADSLNCQPNNCDHNSVLPFADPDYGILPANDPACEDFNAGQPCSPVKGHDHLIGVPETGGDFNVAWHVELVIFTTKAFTDGTVNTRVTTLDQLQALVNNKEVMILDTPITFSCAIVSASAYAQGTPYSVAYP